MGEGLPNFNTSEPPFCEDKRIDNGWIEHQRGPYFNVRWLKSNPFIPILEVMLGGVVGWLWFNGIFTTNGLQFVEDVFFRIGS